MIKNKVGDYSMGEKVENKKNRLGVGFIGVVIVLLFCLGAGYLAHAKGYLFANSTDKIAMNAKNLDKKDKMELREKYLVKLTTQQVKEKLDSGEKFRLYVGRDTCPECREWMPYMLEVLKSKDQKLFYWDTEAANVNKKSKQEVLDILGVTGVPSIANITEKKVSLMDFQVDQKVNVSSFESFLK